MRERGQTLYELMISLVMIGIIAGLCASIVGFARREDRMARGYADDLRHLRTAADMLGLDTVDHLGADDGGITVDCAEDGEELLGGERLHVEAGPDGGRTVVGERHPRRPLVEPARPPANDDM